MVQQIQQVSRKRREQAKLAVSLALANRWGEAARVNREILKDEPGDIESLNRLGKALSELGRYPEARGAFERVLGITPSNPIAKKNLERIGAFGDDAPKPQPRKAVAPHFFIAETGKTGMTTLVDAAPWRLLATLSAGDTVRLEANVHKLAVKTGLGAHIGNVEPRLGLRLLRLIRGGNQYEAAVASLGDAQVRLIIREAFQHPDQAGKLSFPARAHDDFRPYFWDASNLYGDEDHDGAAEASEELEEDGENISDALTDLRRPRRRGHSAAR